MSLRKCQRRPLTATCVSDCPRELALIITLGYKKVCVIWIFKLAASERYSLTPSSNEPPTQAMREAQMQMAGHARKIVRIFLPWLFYLSI